MKLSNPTCTGRVILSINRQGVGLHSVKHLENGQIGMKIEVQQDSEKDCISIGLERFYCTKMLTRVNLCM